MWFSSFSPSDCTVWSGHHCMWSGALLSFLGINLQGSRSYQQHLGSFSTENIPDLIICTWNQSFQILLIHGKLPVQFGSVQSLSHVQLFVAPWTAAHQASLSITSSWSLPKLMSIESVMPSNHLILCHPLLLLPSVPPSIRVFSNESAFTSGGQSIGVSASASVLPMNTQDWSPLGWTGWIFLQSKRPSSLLQCNSSKASILWHSAFFIVQLSHPYMTTGKTIVLTRRTFVGKVMSLLFNMLSRLVITFLPRSKCLLVSWLQSSAAVYLEPPKIKSVTVSTVSPSTYQEVMGPDAMILVFWIWALSQLFHCPLSLSSRGSLVLLHFLS